MGIFGRPFKRRALRKELRGVSEFKGSTGDMKDRKYVENQIYAKRAHGLSKKEITRMTRKMRYNSKDSISPRQSKGLRKKLFGLI